MSEFNHSKKHILVTGGAGFIGSNFIHHALAVRPNWDVINLDALTYAGNRANFDKLPADHKKRHKIIRGDIREPTIIREVFSLQRLDGIIHFAAESHVDRSILGPEVFVETNVLGTFNLLEASRRHWEEYDRFEGFRFLHVSTDEVYGSLGPDGYFTETTAYDPSSPYSASKASSDHFVKSYHRTYALPTLITNCSNNYGPYQFPEKLIPLMILNILENKPLPVYGDGKNVRDWLYVIDHSDAIIRVLESGIPGETYNIGGNSEYQNIGIVHLLCDILDKKLNRVKNSSRKLIEFVEDRPGHDRRYAIDATKIRSELGWSPKYRFEEAIEETAAWYLDNIDWVDHVRSGEYREWMAWQYREKADSGIRE